MEKNPIMVDELRIYPNSWGPFKNGSCHMMCDDIDKLHVFAIKIGLKRRWFHNHKIHPHYDLTPKFRLIALNNGAIFVSALKQARIRLKKRRKNE